MRRRLLDGLISLFVVGMLIAGLVQMPGQAQAQFATNTPTAPDDASPSAPSGFATSQPSGFATLQPAGDANPAESTPVAPSDASEIVTGGGPDAVIDFYALRLWIEADLIALLRQQIVNMPADDPDAIRAVQLTQYELSVRFPNAPTNPAVRDDLISLALSAPRGTVDMRHWVRRLVADELNRSGFDARTAGEFELRLTPLRFVPGTQTDVLVTVTYPPSASASDILYQDYLVFTQAGGRYEIVTPDYDLPAVPFGLIRSIRIIAVADVNRDGLDEVVLLVDDGQLNQRLIINGHRTGLQSTDLVQPGREIRLSEIVRWDYDNPDLPNTSLSILSLRAESEAPDWVCNSELPISWNYENNFYRSSVALNAAFVEQNSLGCTLKAAEPIFGQNLMDAIVVVETAIDSNPLDSASVPRAQMTLATLYAVNGLFDSAREIAQQVLDSNAAGTWAHRQADTLLNALEQPGNTALGICAALNANDEVAACRIDDLIKYYLSLVDLTTSDDLVSQLENYGFPVVETVPVVEIGRAERIGVQFNLAGAGWLAFRTNRDGTYSAERIDPPAGFEPPVPPRPAPRTPSTAFTSLLVDRDPSTTLAIIDTLARNNPGLPLPASARYLRALALDLTANRQPARVAYYELWRDEPGTLWGQLASRHLERR